MLTKSQFDSMILEGVKPGSLLRGPLMEHDAEMRSRIEALEAACQTALDGFRDLFQGFYEQKLSTLDDFKDVAGIYVDAIQKALQGDKREDPPKHKPNLKWKWACHHSDCGENGMCCAGKYTGEMCVRDKIHICNAVSHECWYNCKYGKLWEESK